MRCPICTAELEEQASTCPRCGNAPTGTLTEVSSPGHGSAMRETPGGFSPGRVLSGRYRIVERIGGGGMGDVYRADDLTLDQPVALKFLSAKVADHPQRLQSLRAEVRLARQISHPNVCRVYDIGEAEGAPFLSMEYVRGEDLRSLLQRVSRLPPERASEIAWQLASGLAAAHDHGVLHRDLKPANIVIDERGRARILDFGIAAVAGSVGGPDIRSGTPAYMAPEQREGREVTEKSDLFSLGLVLYEIFTGRRPFSEGASGVTARPPSSLVPGIDPEIDRVVLACLDADPKRRPASALSARTAFRSGDPLALALDRGETPDPDLVAQAGEFTELPRRRAWMILFMVFVALAATVLGARRPRLSELVPLPRSPAVLAADAREILETLGYPEPRDVTFGFARRSGYLDHVSRTVARPDWPTLLRPGEPSVVRFWYRESPRYLIPYRSTELFPGPDDPPRFEPGMVSLELDPAGRLRSLQAAPPIQNRITSGMGLADWARLFEAAKLDLASFREVAPMHAPRSFADRLGAWEGPLRDAPQVRVRVEAAALRGSVVDFRIIEPWDETVSEARDASPFVRSADVLSENGLRALHVGAQCFVLLGVALLARRNLRNGRGDTRLALRLSTVLFVLVMLAWLLASHHIPGGAEMEVFLGGVYRASFTAVLAALLYVGIEPYARRMWPRSLTSWVRLLNGRIRDPLVGRDVLFGCAFGIGGGWALECLGLPLPGNLGWSGRPDVPYNINEYWSLGGPLRALATTVSMSVNIATLVLYLVMALLLLRFVLGNTKAAVVVHWLLTVGIFGSAFGIVPFAFFQALWLGVLLRYGLLSVLVGHFTTALMGEYPMAVGEAAWLWTITAIPVAACAALALLGFKGSLGSQAAFGDPFD